LSVFIGVDADDDELGDFFFQGHGLELLGCPGCWLAFKVFYEEK